MAGLKWLLILVLLAEVCFRLLVLSAYGISIGFENLYHELMTPAIAQLDYMQASSQLHGKNRLHGIATGWLDSLCQSCD